MSFLKVIEVIRITGGISSQTFSLIGSYNFSWICPTLVGLKNKMKIFLVSADVTKLQIILHWWVPSNEHFRRSTWFQQNGWFAFRPLWSSRPVKINETKEIRRKTETGFKNPHSILFFEFFGTLSERYPPITAFCKTFFIILILLFSCSLNAIGLSGIDDNDWIDFSFFSRFWIK